mgnify:CR=1 FL=1
MLLIVLKIITLSSLVIQLWMCQCLRVIFNSYTSFQILTCCSLHRYSGPPENKKILIAKHIRCSTQELSRQQTGAQDSQPNYRHFTTVSILKQKLRQQSYRANHCDKKPTDNKVKCNKLITKQTMYNKPCVLFVYLLVCTCIVNRDIYIQKTLTIKHCLFYHPLIIYTKINNTHLLQEVVVISQLIHFILSLSPSVLLRAIGHYYWWLFNSTQSS